MIICNDTSDLFFFAHLAPRRGPPQRGRPATARQADDDVPVATERGTGDASIYHSLSHFLTFTGSIADIHSRKFTIPIS
jgi:hypothetical protein